MWLLLKLSEEYEIDIQYFAKYLKLKTNQQNKVKIKWQNLGWTGSQYFLCEAHAITGFKRRVKPKTLESVVNVFGN